MSFSASLNSSSNFQSQENGTIAATATSQRIPFGGSGTDFQITNLGPDEAFVAVGPSTVVAVAGGTATLADDGSISVPPGAIVVYNFRNAMGALQGGPPFVAAVSSGTALLRVSQGVGS
jgi:hypothetical protein